jgi:hypothetical protein
MAKEDHTKKMLHAVFTEKNKPKFIWLKQSTVFMMIEL